MFKPVPLGIIRLLKKKFFPRKLLFFKTDRYQTKRQLERYIP